jgi:hypothetical protein
MIEIMLQVRDLGDRFLRYRLAHSGDCPSIEQWIEDKTLKSEPKDPWGGTLSIACPGQHEEGGADIISLGPDGKLATKDDIWSWQLQ